MDTGRAIRSFGALAQETRLEAYRRLVQAGTEGLPAGALAEALGVPSTTLSFHLSQLANAGLVQSRRVGRSIIYSADFGHMNALIGFMTENCCGASSPTACQPVCATPSAPINPEDLDHEAPSRSRRGC